MPNYDRNTVTRMEITGSYIRAKMYGKTLAIAQKDYRGKEMTLRRAILDFLTHSSITR